MTLSFAIISVSCICPLTSSSLSLLHITLTFNKRVHSPSSIYIFSVALIPPNILNSLLIFLCLLLIVWPWNLHSLKQDLPLLHWCLECVLAVSRSTPKDPHALILGAYDYVALHGKRGSVDRTKVKDLEMRHCPGWSRWTQDNHTSPQKLRSSWLQRTLRKTQPPFAGFADVGRGHQP